MSLDIENLHALRQICDHLTERSATLFLGSGVNANVRNQSGEPFPLGNDLARIIAKDLLNSPDSKLSLRQVAEMARHRVGAAALNNYIFEKFSTFEPGVAHLALVQLPWDIVYTTNFDLLVENAAKMQSVAAAGYFQPIVSMQTNLEQFSEDDILYYKLHGSVDVANTSAGRLILTQSDFSDYELYRRPLFKRLERDLPRRMFVFVGYSMSDENFLNILEGCRLELGTTFLPLSYAVRKGFEDTEEHYWRDKYNIQLLRDDSEEFLLNLKETWFSEQRSVISVEERRAKEFLEVDANTRFPKVAESYYRVDPCECTGPSNARRFFMGSIPTWADIRDQVPPKRNAYWSVLGAMFEEFSDPTIAPSVYLNNRCCWNGKDDPHSYHCL
jgi:hypothetical protein